KGLNEVSNIEGTWIKSHGELRQYLKQITLAQEEERLRIAREIHDTAIQSLIVILHQTESFLEKNDSCSMPYTRFLFSLIDQIKTIIQELRSLSANLRPSILDHLGLLPAIKYLAAELEKNFGLEVNLVVLAHSFRLLPEVEIAIFRIVQEALQNIVRHAEADKVNIVLELNKDIIQILIKDNGRGIPDLPRILNQLPQQGKLGLAGMCERVELIGGEICLVTGQGVGTTINVRVPVRSIKLG
ncbi:MAG TPA: sensor histidine kinase, partial [Bacillota bacterium]|nr:sensor histidine kinase [Bacillota bacterium]